jgi:hypothetical protein
MNDDSEYNSMVLCWIELARANDTIERLRSQIDGLEAMARSREGHIDRLERQLDYARLQLKGKHR